MFTTPQFRLGRRLGRLFCVLLAVAILAAACTGRKQVAAPSPSVPPTATATAGDTSPPPASASTGTASPAPSSAPGSASTPRPAPLT